MDSASRAAPISGAEAASGSLLTSPAGAGEGGDDALAGGPPPADADEAWLACISASTSASRNGST
eukprot:2021269-Lingulodinium_polyedra.AAC.1